MKLLVFAHTPPPHHGQSYMVQLMLEGFGGDARRRKPFPDNAVKNGHGIECYHVNARFSRGLSDVGEFQGAKIFLILWFCAQAVWIRFRHGVTNFYYVPAPGKRMALYRDWLVMLLCRPFFDKMILHWHAAGLAKWLETENPIQFRAFTWRLFRPVDLSVVISRYNFADGQKLLSRRIIVVNNGIPDPCPDFEEILLKQRHKRFLLRQKVLAGETHHSPVAVHVLFLAHCTREKGLFAAIEAVRQANRLLHERGLPMRLQLTVAGNFVNPGEQAEFDRIRRDPELTGVLRHAGFVSGDRKSALYREADIFCFPTRYLGENQPVNLIEAMAFGLPIVTTRWRSLPEMFPENYPGLVNGQDPEEIAGALLQVLGNRSGELARNHFCARFTLENHLAS
ncbi:MAG TPA: glycosyltransferase family 4 protein, partial [Candidatus Binatia bacterium]|nr:glycosyltransferase family 4 protein [Candidatus Binatia bacterium]